MKFTKFAFAPLALAIGLGACSENDSESTSAVKSAVTDDNVVVTEAQQASQNDAFLSYLESLAIETLREQPFSATSLGVTEDYLGQSFNDKLGDMSQASVEKAKADNEKLQKMLAEYDPAKLSGTALTTYQLLKNSLELGEKFKSVINGAYGPYSYFTPFTITHISGPHVNLPRSLQTQHPLTSEKDAQDYLSRLSAIQPEFNDLVDVLMKDIEMGVIPPKFAVEGAIGFVEQFLSPAASKHPLTVTFTSRLKANSELSEEQVDSLTAEVVAVVESSVYPAYKQLKGTLDIMLEKASDHAGVWDLENGEKLYDLALQNFGAGDKTAEEIHQLGLSEVARIQKEMGEILKAEGFETDDVIGTYNQLNEDPQFLYANNDEGRQELLDDLNKQMDVIDALLPEILLTLPKAGVEVQRISEFEQDGAPGGYYTPPSLDGSRPGIYWINLKDTADWPKFTLPTLTYHEASPGHHLQVAIAQEIADMPMLRNMIWYSAYGEGWALYAEVLAKELGLYDSDPMGDLGRLQSELFRAARLVVDTGLHYKKWSREEAIEYMHGAIGGSKAAVTREVERYAVWPGQACSYKLGQLTILELRETAKQQLGDKFDIRSFNDETIIHGAISLPVLREKIEAWIAKQA